MGNEMTTTEMRKATHHTGQWFVNVSPLGEEPNWVIQVMPPDASTEITHLFGYDVANFLGRQYKDRS